MRKRDPTLVWGGHGNGPGALARFELEQGATFLLAWLPPGTRFDGCEGFIRVRGLSPSYRVCFFSPHTAGIFVAYPA